MTGNARARRFYEREGWRDEGDVDNPVDGPDGPIAVPCRLYVKDLPRPALAESLDLEPHPEGGWYRQTWASPVPVTLPDGRVRPTATLIHFLLPAGESSAWHRVRSDEVWLAHTGTVTLELGGSDDRPWTTRAGQRRDARRRAGRRLAAHAPGRRRRAGQLPGLAGLRLRGLRARVSPRVAVLGGTGKTGRAVCRAVGPGAVPLGRAAWDDLPGALTGCDALYVIAPNMHPDEQAYVAAALEAARDAGVRRVVHHSVASPYLPAMPHHLGKARAEDVVRRSGVDWTVLQPGAYLQNFSWAGPPRIAYRADAPFGFADLDDVAAVAALVLADDVHVGATYELASVRATVADLAAEHGTRGRGGHAGGVGGHGRRRARASGTGVAGRDVPPLRRLRAAGGHRDDAGAARPRRGMMAHGLCRRHARGVPRLAARRPA